MVNRTEIKDNTSSLKKRGVIVTSSFFGVGIRPPKLGCHYFLSIFLTPTKGQNEVEVHSLLDLGSTTCLISLDRLKEIEREGRFKLSLKEASIIVQGIGTQMIHPIGEVDLLLRLHQQYYTHLRAHETPEHLVCRLLLEKK